MMGIYEDRYEYVMKFSHALLNEAAIKTIIEHSPIIEIGAGTGFWAKHIAEAGGDILAFDKVPCNTWFPVEFCDFDIINQYPERTLFLCWPPYNDPMAYEYLRRYHGNTLLAITEGPGNCCGGDDFWDEITLRWHQVKDVKIPQFRGIHDYLGVYERANFSAIP